MPFEDKTYSQGDVANNLSQAISLIGKGSNFLQIAMWHLCDSLAKIETMHPELGTMRVWLAKQRETSSGLPSGIFRKASIREQLTGATLCIGRGAYEEAIQKIVKAIGMLQWVAGTKSKVLTITTTPAAQARHVEGS